MQIQTLTIKAFPHIAQSAWYKNCPVKPISLPRIQSYIHNPFARPSDVSLYLLWDNNTLVAFRNVWADCWKTPQETTRFGWLSGAWVAPSYRRKGYSQLLLKQVIEDWNGRLMHTNFAPASAKLIDKTGIEDWLQIYGGSVYLKDVSSLLHRKFRWMKYIPSSLRFFENIPFRLFQSSPPKKPSYADVAVHHGYCSDLETWYAQNNFCGFLRNAQSLKWRFDFPWIEEQPSVHALTLDHYPFSWKAYKIKRYTVELKDPKQYQIGMAVVFISENKANIHFFRSEPALHKEALSALVHWLLSQDLEQIDTYNTSLFHALRPYGLYAHAKKQHLRVLGIRKPDKLENIFHTLDGDMALT